MAERNDFVGEPMTLVSETEAPLTTETGASLTIEVPLMIADKTYVKTILKSEIKITKLNFDNYQN